MAGNGRGSNNDGSSFGDNAASPEDRPTLAQVLAHADRRTLAAVVTHLAGEANAVPDLRDRSQIEARAAAVLPAYLRGERHLGAALLE